MNSIFISFFQEPAAVCEFFVAILTACYLFKLTFLSIAQQKTWMKSQLQSSYDTGCCINTWNSNEANSTQNIKYNFLKFFAVGEQIPTTKKSLRKQFFQKLSRLYRNEK